jgi:hypothetical protein
LAITVSNPGFAVDRPETEVKVKGTAGNPINKNSAIYRAARVDRITDLKLWQIEHSPFCGMKSEVVANAAVICAG